MRIFTLLDYKSTPWESFILWWTNFDTETWVKTFLQEMENVAVFSTDEPTFRKQHLLFISNPILCLFIVN